MVSPPSSAPRRLAVSARPPAVSTRLLDAAAGLVGVLLALGLLALLVQWCC